MHFREEPVTLVYRHWMCEEVGCNGELLSTGESITRLSTEASLRQVRPRRLGGAIGPDNSYTCPPLQFRHCHVGFD